MKLSALQLWSPHLIPRTAIALEEFGYERYWLSEHHGTGAYSGSPLILTAVVAGLTSRIRTGPAGVLLHYHSPLKVAEDIRMLQLLFPGRIDLGIARAVEPNADIANALLDGRPNVGDFQKKVRDLLSFVGAAADSTSAVSINIPPNVETAPEAWLLGTTLESARLAGALGVRYSFSRIIADDPRRARDALNIYRDTFRRPDAEPYCSVAMSFICSEPGDAIDAYPGRPPSVRGDAEIVYDCLATASDECAVDEIVLVDMSSNLGMKVDSYGRIAERCGLTQSHEAKV